VEDHEERKMHGTLEKKEEIVLMRIMFFCDFRFVV